MELADIVKTIPSSKEDRITNGYRSHSIEFLREMESILPFKVEFLYSILAQLVSLYYKRVEEIEELGANIDYMPTYTDFRNEQLLELESLINRKKIELTELDKQLEELLKEKRYTELSVYSSKCAEIQQEIEKIEKEIQSNKQSLEDIRERSIERQSKLSEKQEELKEIIRYIGMIKTDIQKISINGKDRIDGIEVHKKHIDNLFKIIDDNAAEEETYYGSEAEQKDNAKKSKYSAVLYIINYIHAIKEYYKLAVKLSDDITTSYDQRRVLHKDDSEESIMFEGMRKLFISAPDSYEVDMMVSRPKESKKIEKSHLNNTSECYSMFTELLKNGKYKNIQLEEIEELMEATIQKRDQGIENHNSFQPLVDVLWHLRDKNPEFNMQAESNKKIV